MAGPYAIPMQMLLRPVLCACLAGAVPVSPGFAHPFAVAQDHGQDAARQRRQAGQGISVREIERRVIPRMPGAQYLGFDYDPGSDIYTLKFLRNGTVIWVDVDGRSGRILRTTGD